MIETRCRFSDKGPGGEVEERGEGTWKSADKPGSVGQRTLPGSHSSGRRVAATLKQPTRKQREPRYRFPIWPCPGWGLPGRPCHHGRGGLLPVARRAAPPRPGGRSTISPLPAFAEPAPIGLPTRPRGPGPPPARQPLVRLAPAVCFLLHFPSPHGARPLAGILLCGARTFLHTPKCAATAWRTSAADYTRVPSRDVTSIAPRQTRARRP